MATSSFSIGLQLAFDSPRVWLPCFGKILTKEQSLVYLDGEGGYAFTPYQLKILEAYEYCMAEGIQCRILGLKDRQGGSTTVCTGIIYHHCRRNRTKAVQMADRSRNSNNLFEMTKRYAEHDTYPWPNKWDATQDDAFIRLQDGSEWSTIVKDTAENPRAGRSATFQAIHVSEAAHFPVDGVKSADKTLLSLLGALVDGPNTVGIVETTANGAAGWFYQYWFGDASIGLEPAVTLEELRSGKTGNGWIKVFGPWFEGFGCTKPVNPGNIADIDATLTEREHRGMTVYGWRHEHIAWRRHVIQTKMKGAESSFDQEYPESERVAFLTSGRPRFSIASVARIRTMCNVSPRTGFLNLHGDDPRQRTVSWSPGDSGWAQIFEPPRIGCRYLLWVDTSTGAEQTKGSNNPDRHSALVIRHGYSDGETSLNHRLVARIAAPCNDSWQPLEEKVIAFSLHYGKCIVGVEVPMGLTLLEGLRRAGIPIWKRREPGKPLDEGKPGFSTNSATKPSIIDALSRALDEPCLDINCPHVCGELETFVVHSDGKEAALNGLHDDDVLALAMGILNIGSATPMRQTTVRKPAPADDRSWKSVGGVRNSGYTNWV